jgi:hypothetical protein
VKMLCGCIRFGSKAKATSGDVESARQDSSTSEWSFHRSDAPSPPERLDTSADGFGSLVAPERAVVMEPSINSPIQALENIDEIILSNTTI